MKSTGASLILASLLIFSTSSFSEEIPKIETPSIEEGTKIYRINKIEFKGIQNIDYQIIKPLIPFEKGGIVTRDKLENTIRDLYKLGYFQNVEAYTRYTENGIDLTFVFKELPVVQRIEFEGNKNISTEDLLKEIGISTEEKMESGKALPFTSMGPELAEKLSSIKKGLGRVLSADEISQMKKRIEKLYEKRGFYEAKVSYYYKGNTLVFQIDEGERAYVAKINIIGNKQIKTKEILSVMETSERNIFKLKIYPTLVKETLYDDISRIKDYYISKGFFDVQIEEPIIELKDNKKYYITIKINEGDRYKVKDIKFENNNLFTTKEIFEPIKKRLIKPGEYYDEEKIDLIKKITIDKYNELGYIFANVEINKLVDKENKTVEVVLNVQPGNVYYVDKINITGNYESRDATIRRELRFAPGDLLRKEDLERSQARLNRLGYYDFASFEPKLKTENALDIDVNVRERFTGQMSIGAGYSQLTGLSLFASIKKGNFLGTGDVAGLSLSIGSKYKNNELSYLHRWAFYKPLDLGFNLYDRSIDYTTFTSIKTGISTNLSYEFWEYWRTGVGVALEKGEIKDVTDAATTYVKLQQGKYDLYSVYTFINRNSVDNPLLPTSGSDITATFKVGTGTRDFYKVVLSATKFIPDRIFYTDFVFSIKGTIGLVEKISKSIPLDELFFVGGDFTIRGFSYGGAGPVDSNNDPLGAKRQIVLNYQVAHPIVERFLWGYAFLDQGKGFDSGNFFSNMYNSAGVGMKIITPFAPIELYYGKVLNPPAGVSSSRFGFILGTFF
ncbi:outer membrane protein assembly factor BamA [Venenivibrio stagnispumantis]|uniref:outer membrane protein assembly factor BamA n=1 Tax=Venenivibrio stagnispumantis TaxID=407998 RepID=UPI0022365961|nr:outer membrane protein assembly factor BamA [Venenivibrio stagnispumantis]MCW4573888.1 outer membrane protein assembly factor BamA [Venenivibrio stagnispumantis]